MEYMYLNSKTVVFTKYRTCTTHNFSKKNVSSEALWEKTHDYTDIERFYTRCDATNCICPDGRTFSDDQMWELQLCSCCGSFGYHKLCRPEQQRDDAIICNVCRNVVQRSSQPNEQRITDEEAVSLVDQNQGTDANVRLDGLDEIQDEKSDDKRLMSYLMENEN